MSHHQAVLPVGGREAGGGGVAGCGVGYGDGGAGACDRIYRQRRRSHGLTDNYNRQPYYYQQKVSSAPVSTRNEYFIHLPPEDSTCPVMNGLQAPRL